MSETLEARIYDRLTVDWLTPSQKHVWEQAQQFDGPPHRVINIYGVEGTGKTFLGRLMERLNYSTYHIWPYIQKPLLPRLTLDDVIADRSTTRNLRPLVMVAHFVKTQKPVEIRATFLLFHSPVFSFSLDLVDAC